MLPQVVRTESNVLYAMMLTWWVWMQENKALKLTCWSSTSVVGFGSRAPKDAIELPKAFILHDREGCGRLAGQRKFFLNWYGSESLAWTYKLVRKCVVAGRHTGNRTGANGSFCDIAIFATESQRSESWERAIVGDTDRCQWLYGFDASNPLWTTAGIAFIVKIAWRC